MKKLLIALVLVFCVSGSDAEAVDVWLDGNKLHEWCQSENPISCLAYVLGVSDVLTGGHFDPKYKLCDGPNATIRQYRDIVIKYLDDHPEERHVSAWSLVSLALHDAFQCK
jgi:hypothetical protein